jgi:CheY-like chemotaxis protein
MANQLVLIADDVKLFLAAQRTLLEEAGLDVITVESGREALEQVRQRHPNLIMLDLHMPGMDGAATCAAIRQEPGLECTPIIVMSGRDSKEAQQRSANAGCSEFVVKPDKAEDLLGLVARLLAARRRRATWISVVYGYAEDRAHRQTVGRAADLSGTGLLLISGNRLGVGGVLDLEFVVPTQNHTVSVKGKVVRSGTTSSDAYEAGIHFIEISQGDQEVILDYVGS